MEENNNKITRRTNREGTLYQKKRDLTWVYQVTITTNDGDSVRKAFTGKTQDIAIKKYRDFLKEQKKERAFRKDRLSGKIPEEFQIDPEFQSITLVDWVEQYIVLYKKPPHSKDTTYSSYMRYCRTHINRFFGKLRLRDVNQNHIQMFYDFLSSDEGRLDGTGPLSPKTIQNIHVLLREALEKPVGKVYEVNPAVKTIRPEVIEKEMRVLTKEEMQVFMKEIFVERLRCAMMISLFTGVRLGELLALTWDDVDFDSQCIHIHENIIRIELFDDPSGRKTKLIKQETPKSNKSDRSVPLQDGIFKMLKIHQQLQVLECYPNPLNLVFPSKKGTYTDPRTYQKRVAAVMKRCQILGVNVHALRHTFATRLVEQNIPLVIIKNLLGHASIETTMKYTHALQSEKRKAVDVLKEFAPTLGR